MCNELSPNYLKSNNWINPFGPYMFTDNIWKMQEGNILGWPKS